MARMVNSLLLAFGLLAIALSAETLRAQTQAEIVAEQTFNSLAPKKVLEEFLKDPRVDPSVKEDLVRDGKLLKATNWATSKKSFIAFILKEFDTEEQKQIAEFMQTAAGKKYFDLQAKMLARLLVRASISQKETRARGALLSSVPRIVESAIPSAKAVLERALAGPGIDEKLLLGRWFTRDEEDGEFLFVGWHEKSEDGVNLSAGVYIDHENKFYDKFLDPGVWKVQGRLVIEVNFSSLEEPNLFVIDKLTKDELVWRIVDPELEPSEWLKSVEGRKPIAFPSRPAGYEDANQ